MQTKGKSYSKDKRNKYSSKGRVSTNGKVDSDEGKWPGRKARVSSSKDNDVSWYASSDQLLKDVASIPFGYATGVPFKLDNTFQQQTVFPGVLALYNAPAPGVSVTGHTRVAPINVAAQKIFAYVRKSNAGGTNYDVPDLMLYLMAIDSMYAYVAFLMRIYGILNSYNQLNRYIPDGLLTAMGVANTNGNVTGDASVKAHLAEFRAYINMLVLRVNSFAVPGDIKLFSRHFWMYSGIYKDEDTAKAQFYMYVPAYLYRYAIDQTTSAGKLTPIEIACDWNDTQGWIPRTTPVSFNRLKSIGNTLLESLVYQQDIAIMSGDILKAYGEGSLMKLNQISEELRLVPSFSEEVLTQIHNTSFVGTKPTTASGTVSRSALEITQQTDIGTGDLVFEPKFVWGGGNHHTHVLDFWKDVVTPADVMVATRNMVQTSRPDSNRLVSLESCGSDFVLAGEVVRFDPISGTFGLHNIYEGNAPRTSIVDLQDVDAGVFNQRPTRIIYNLDTEGNPIPAHIDGEISNFALINGDDLAEMHEVALLNMFGVPYLP